VTGYDDAGAIESVNRARRGGDMSRRLLDEPGKSPQSGGRGLLEALEIVSPFQSEDSAVVWVDLTEFRRHPPVVLGNEGESGHVIIGVGVETCAHQHPRWLELSDDGYDQLSPGSAIDIPRRPRHQRDVDIRPFGLPLLYVPDMTGERVEVILVDRDIQSPRIVGEASLSAVPVMHIPVQDGHPLTARTEICRSHRDIVEDAEAHGAVPEGMVSGRAGDGKAGNVARSLQLVDQSPDSPSRGESRLPRLLGDEGVDVECPTAELTERLDHRYVRRIVDQRQLAASDLRRRDLGETQPARA
jgi:hypothetical protein